MSVSKPSAVHLRDMEFVKLRFDGSLAVVQVNRPPLNAISLQVAVELNQAFMACEPAAIRAVVVTGQENFAVGGDIKGFEEELASNGEEMTGPALASAIDVLEGLSKPTFAAIRGYALGGGLELALGVDFRFVSATAKLGQPETRLGLIPGAGGTQRLPRLVGYQRAKELIFSGRQFGAEEALRIGLCDRILADDETLDATLSEAVSWASQATVALGAAKKAINDGYEMPIAAGLIVEQGAFRTTFRSNDAREGVSAFLNKRPPDFDGD